MSEHGRHEAPEQPVADPGLAAELADAVTPRTVALVVGVLLLQLGFILSYVGAFHSPSPHRISLGVVAPAQQSAQLVRQLDGITSAPLAARTVSSEQSATRQIRRGSLSSALLVDPTGDTDRLLVASGGGVPVADAVEQVVRGAESRQQRSITVTDLVPVQSGDYRGLSGFYLVIGWIVGGYLVASLLGVSSGSRPATPRRAVIRLAAMTIYAVVSGLGGALVVDHGLHALRGHLLALWWLGALLVLASATVTMAFQVLFGTIGIGITVLVFVVLGNPSAGGAYQPSLLPPFWRAISSALPNGAGTDAVRRIVYFSSHGLAGDLVVIAVYAAGGILVALLGSVLLHRHDRPPTEAAGGGAPAPSES